ncbi:MAG: hypothetical protein U0Z26_19060 [Anaerolineales bacterium]
MGDIIFGLYSIVRLALARCALYWLRNFLLSLLPTRIFQKVNWLSFLTPAAVLVIVVLIAPLFQL